LPRRGGRRRRGGRLRPVGGLGAAGWRDERPGDHVVCAPICRRRRRNTRCHRRRYSSRKASPVRIPGPDDRTVHTSYLLPDCTVVVELATSSGLALTDRTQPLRTYTRGFEVAIAAALDRGADRPLLPIGGSSATDVVPPAAPHSAPGRPRHALPRPLACPAGPFTAAPLN
jgi:hypothetical protein